MPEKKEKTLNEKLMQIQAELKAPKGQFNAFGKYKYRSCEDILEAVKPLLGDATLTLNDEIVVFGAGGNIAHKVTTKDGTTITFEGSDARFYVKTTVTIELRGESKSCSAFAREPFEKKGMDEMQLSGATSSYARKYALNGLFAIDDAKDSDNGKPNGNDKPIEKSLEIVEQAFFNFTTENADALVEGFVFDKDKFIKAIVKHFKQLPTKEESIKKITSTIKPAECITELPKQGEQNE